MERHLKITKLQWMSDKGVRVIMRDHRNEPGVSPNPEIAPKTKSGKSSQTLREQMDALNEHVARLEEKIRQLNNTVNIERQERKEMHGDLTLYFASIRKDLWDVPRKAFELCFKTVWKATAFLCIFILIVLLILTIAMFIIK